MGMSLTTAGARARLRLLGVACVVLAAIPLPSAVPQERPDADAGPRAGQNQDLKDMVALQEKQVAIKRAVVRVADAQKNIAVAKLKVLKTKVSAAAASEALAKTKMQRFKQLVNEGSVGVELLNEAEISLRSASGLRQEAEDAVLVGEAEVHLEMARREVAEAQLALAELRLKQLRERLASKK